MQQKSLIVTAVGACHLDRKARAAASLVIGASNPVALRSCPGGVARNVAENLVRLGAQVALVSRLGRDAEGETLLATLSALAGELAIDIGGVTLSDSAPGAFHLIALEPDGEMLVAVADMRVYDEITPALLDRLPANLWAGDAIFADCNLPEEALGWLAARRSGATRLAVNGVSPAKALRLRPYLSACDLLFVNRGEAASLLDRTVDATEPTAATAALRQAGVGEVVMTLGEAGVCVAGEEEAMVLQTFESRVVDITGAGDALAAAYLEARLRNLGIGTAARRALAAAQLTVASAESVSPAMSPQALDRLVTA